MSRSGLKTPVKAYLEDFQIWSSHLKEMWVINKSWRGVLSITRWSSRQVMRLGLVIDKNDPLRRAEPRYAFVDLLLLPHI